MYQRFRNATAAALVLGFAASVSCSDPPEDDDDSGFSGNATSSDQSASNGSGGTSGNADTSGNGTSANSSGGASSGNVQSATSLGDSNTSGSSTSGPAIGGDLGQACPGLPVMGAGGSDGCVGTGYEAESLPVDLVLMVDVSTSMVDNQVDGVTRWELVRDAVATFVQDPDAADIGMGIQFFSYLNEDDCSSAKYADPAVAIGLAGDIQDDIISALDDQSPGGLTPTYPALDGAIQYAKSYASDNPTRQAVVVFVTDGYPTRCDPNAPGAEQGAQIPDVADLAEASWNEDPKVPVFVVGIDGTYNLDQIARSGGTREAFNVENNGSTDRLVTALKNITTDTARCEFEIPEPDNSEFVSVDTELVQVIYTPSSGDPQEIPKVSGYAACAGSENGGWYFGGADANGNPTKVVVCPCSCANFAAGKVEVALGCKATPVLE